MNFWELVAAVVVGNYLVALMSVIIKLAIEGLEK
jgi:hypothetical protein